LRERFSGRYNLRGGCLSVRLGWVMRGRIYIALILFGAWGGIGWAAATTQPIVWRGWSDDVFRQAKRENKFVLLDLHAVWCHWCHVMDEDTYRDPAVIKLIGEKYIAVGVDADSRPDLSNRYEDYGWPATVVFGPDGKEIVKRQGYIPPKQMASMLQAIIDDPTPGPSVRAERKVQFTDQTNLSDAVRKELLWRQNELYDNTFGSWGTVQKFMDWDGVEWCLRQAARGDKDARRMARQTLTEQMNLIDPVWGGVDQYSTDGDWKHPHYEKIMQFQAENLRVYALAYSQWHEAADLKAAQDIHRYLVGFLRSPDGGFYTSQDADAVPGEQGDSYFRLNDVQRRARGVPRIDEHQYARENGWAIVGLTTLYGGTGDRTALDQATAAARWVVQNRSLDGGGFRHDGVDAGGPYLGDTLAMGRGSLALYEVTGDRNWLVRSEAAARFIEKHFWGTDGPGVASSDVGGHAAFAPSRELDENIGVARWANLLNAYSGNKADRKLALTAMRYVATPEIAEARGLGAGILLADAEVSGPPLHITIVGGKDDAAAAKLFAAALGIPEPYKRVEWYDAREGALMNADVEYPALGTAAAFLCSGTTCSSPAFSATELMEKWARSRR
jgi:uncharacterized protein